MAELEDFDFGYNATMAETGIALATYPRIEPGDYTGRIVKVYGPYLDRGFGVWKLRVEFALTTGELVSAFYNMGSGKTPSLIKPRHKLFRLLVLASGYGKPNVNPSALVNPVTLYRVHIGWSKSGDYSVVTEVLGLSISP
jgi:hypothetical protein